jgi:hypothetical protein
MSGVVQAVQRLGAMATARGRRATSPFRCASDGKGSRAQAPTTGTLVRRLHPMGSTMLGASRWKA